MSAAIHFLQGLPIVAMALTIMLTVTAVGWLVVTAVSRYSNATLKKAYRELPPALCGALMAGQVILCALLASSVWKDLGSAQ